MDSNEKHGNSYYGSHLFMKKEVYDKITKKKDNLPYNKDEYKHYRKRILELVKDLLNKKDMGQDIKEHFQIFVFHAIEYLKFQDKSNIIQTDLEEQEEEQREKEQQDFSQETYSVYQKEEEQEKEETTTNFHIQSTKLLQNRRGTIEDYIPIERKRYTNSIQDETIIVQPIRNISQIIPQQRSTMVDMKISQEKKEKKRKHILSKEEILERKKQEDERNNLKNI